MDTDPGDPGPQIHREVESQSAGYQQLLDIKMYPENETETTWMGSGSHTPSPPKPIDKFLLSPDQSLAFEAADKSLPTKAWTHNGNQNSTSTP